MTCRIMMNGAVGDRARSNARSCTASPTACAGRGRCGMASVDNDRAVIAEAIRQSRKPNGHKKPNREKKARQPTGHKKPNGEENGETSAIAPEFSEDQVALDFTARHSED